MSTVLIFGAGLIGTFGRAQFESYLMMGKRLKIGAGIIGTRPNMITFYRISIYEYSSNPSQTLAAEFRRRFLSSLTNMRTLLYRPVFETIRNRGGPSCDILGVQNDLSLRATLAAGNTCWGVVAVIRRPRNKLRDVEEALPGQ